MTKPADIDPDTQHALNIFVTRAKREYDMVGAILFGSRARQDFRPDSDADLAVLLQGRRHRFLDINLALADIAYDVLLETGILIHPLPVWEDEWQHPERYTAPALLRNISREGVPI